MFFVFFSTSYEPELHPAVTYKLKDPKATLKIFSTGSITVTAPSVRNVQVNEQFLSCWKGTHPPKKKSFFLLFQLAIEHIYSLVEEFKKPKARQDLSDDGPGKMSSSSVR